MPNEQPDKNGYGCQQTREGKISCKDMDKEQWRSNYNMALEKQEALRKELSYIENVLKKLKTKKPSETKRYQPIHTPCTCINPNRLGDSNFYSDFRLEFDLIKNLRVSPSVKGFKWID